MDTKNLRVHIMVGGLTRDYFGFYCNRSDHMEDINMSTKRNIPFHSPEYRCLNCNRILTSDLKEVDNDAVSQDCWCGHRNYFDAIDGHWEQTAVKILPEP